VTTTSFTNVSSASQLSEDIMAIDVTSQADGGDGTDFSITLARDATLTEQADIAAINLAGNDTFTLDGQGSVPQRRRRLSRLLRLFGRDDDRESDDS
jgi:hypothetical protein